MTEYQLFSTNNAMNSQQKLGALFVATLLTVGACQPASDGSDSATNTRPPEAVESSPETNATGTTPMDTASTVTADTVSNDSVPS